MGLKKTMYGYEVEHMSNLAFRLMSLVFSLRDLLFSVDKKLDQFSIEQGSILVDFGCGPGSYVEYASKLVGKGGRVYAVDVQPLAIKAINGRIQSKKLENVIPVLSCGYPVNIDRHKADVIYALDMFHHVQDTREFLKELHRLLRPDGRLFIESGHQKMDSARTKLAASGFWVITEERGNIFTCRPRQDVTA